MKINLFEVKDEYGFDSNWWKHINSSDFGHYDRLQNIGSYSVDEEDILYLNQRAPEGYFEKFWFIVTDEGLERTDLREVKQILKQKLVDFVRSNKLLPYCCSVARVFKNKKIQINYEPTRYDKIIMKYSPGEFGIEELEDFFEGLESIEENPAVSQPKSEKMSRPRPKASKEKLKLFPSGIRIIVHRGYLEKIEEREREYEGNVYIQYMLHLKDGIYELEDQKEESFDKVIAQISENLFTKVNPKVGEILYCKGRTKNDWTFGDIIHNIRTLKKV